LLPQIDCITSVSGGSILAGVLANRWRHLRFEQGRAVNFSDEVMAPVQAFCSHTIDVELGLKGWVNPFKSAGDYLVDCYNTKLFHDITLKQLATPADGAPLFTFYATNLQTGRSFRFRQDRLSDYKLGEASTLEVPLALAVAASSAFPPLFSPILLHSDVTDWVGGELTGPAALRERIVLADGGIYDNMGLEQLMGSGRSSTDIVLVSDAGAPFDLEEKPHENPVSQLGRVRDILIDQTRALRKRWLIDQFENHRRAGAYWGVTTKIGAYEASAALAQDNTTTDKLDEVPTRLAAFEPDLQGRLINWGYALCDAALRTKAGLDVPPSLGLPCPRSPLS
jgi:NTE family protein